MNIKSKSSSYRSSRTRQTYRNIVTKFKINRAVKSALSIRSEVIKIFEQKGKTLQEKMQVMVSNIPVHLDQHTFTEFIGGSRCHTNHSEPYFYETGYTILPNNFNLVLDERGIVRNVHKEVETIGHRNVGLKWPCGHTCYVRQNTLDKIQGFIMHLAEVQTTELLTLFESIDSCHNVCKTNQLGHSLTCQENSNCMSMLRCLNEIKCHYTAARSLTATIYNLKALATNVRNLDSALLSGSLSEIETVIEASKNSLKQNPKDDTSSTPFNRPTVDEGEILGIFGKNMAHCFKEINNFHDTPCSSCNQLHQKSELCSLQSMFEKQTFNNEAWLQLRAYWIFEYEQPNESEFIANNFICKYCKEKLDANKIPPRCCINGLEVDDLPESLKSLNLFETILLQKAKCFQTVVRLGPVRNKLPHSEMLKSVKGRVVYLPLPVQEHVSMIPQGLPPNHELHVLVNGIPTKNKIVWQDIVKIDKLKKAFNDLAIINPLYESLIMTEEEIEDYVFGPNNREFKINPGPDSLLEESTNQNCFFVSAIFHPAN